MIAVLVAIAVAADGDSSLPDMNGIRHAGELLVVGARRGADPTRIDSGTWRSPAAFGQSGPLDAARDLPGAWGQGELSGKICVEGVPHEATAVTWDGAEIPWPWHFGGLFGALDASSVGDVAWDPSGGAASPARGGGWLRTRSRASTGAEGFHGSAELGTVSGAAGLWGGGGGFSWQATARRTWIDPALRLARDRGWTDQSTELMFWDASAAAAWARGPWRVGAGVFRSRDTLSLGGEGSTGNERDSWSNVAVPAGVSWSGDRGTIEVDGSWSRFSKVEGDAAVHDRLELLSLRIAARRRVADGIRLEVGLRERRWTNESGSSWPGLEGDPGDRERLFQELHAGLRLWDGPAWMEAWGGFGLDRRDSRAAQGGASAGWSDASWTVRLDAIRRLLPLAVLPPAIGTAGSASPTWVLPPGSSARSDLLQLDVERAFGPAGGSSSLRVRSLSWIRRLDGIWSWETVDGDASLAGDQPLRRAFRSDGGSWGSEISLRARRGSLEAGARQGVSWDVLRCRSDDGGSYPADWAPWGQRWQTEIDASWSWLGGARSAPGAFFVRTRGAARFASGVLRTSTSAWEVAGTAQGAFPEIPSWPVSGARRARYARVDLTPVEFGREGSWCAWWSVANLLGARNAMGWVHDNSFESESPIEQIPFLPVVLGARVQF